MSCTTKATREDELGGMVVCRPDPIPYTTGGTLGFQLLSDLHIGAPDVDYKLIEGELHDANGWDRRILVNGDIFDLILPKDQKRFQPSCLHKRLQGCNDVLNKAIDWGEEILGPYADRIDMIGSGNHETALEKHHGVDPILLLVDRLNHNLSRQGSDHRVHHGGYTGFLDYRFVPLGKAALPSRNRKGQRLVMFYHHGWGGGASLSGAASDEQRSRWVEGASVVWLGHKHARMTADTRRVSCPLQGHTPASREVRFVRTGSYQRPYHGQTQAGIHRSGRKGGYASDAGLPPQGVGGAVVLVRFDTPTSYSLKVLQ